MLQSEFFKRPMILFLKWPEANTWRQPAFRIFTWVCSSTEYYGLVLDRNNQYDLKSRKNMTNSSRRICQIRHWVILNLYYCLLINCPDPFNSAFYSPLYDCLSLQLADDFAVPWTPCCMLSMIP